MKKLIMMLEKQCINFLKYTEVMIHILILVIFLSEKLNYGNNITLNI